MKQFWNVMTCETIDGYLLKENIEEVFGSLAQVAKYMLDKKAEFRAKLEAKHDYDFVSFGDSMEELIGGFSISYGQEMYSQLGYDDSDFTS